MKILKNISFSLLGIIVVLLICSTFIEAIKGSDFVQKHIYQSISFVVLWAIFTTFALSYIIKKKRYRNPIVFLLHVSFVVILVGAFTTWRYGQKGQIYLRVNEKTNTYHNAEGNNLQFPFSVKLTKFTINYYDGTQTPQDFISSLQFISLKGKQITEERVSMNSIITFRGYRFYQQGYDKDAGGSYISVAYDPYGIGITYFGYALLLLTIIGFFFDKRNEFYDLLKSPLLKGGLSVLLVFSPLALLADEPEASPRVLPQTVAEEFCDLYVLYNGRICPMQTLAKDFSIKLYGKATYKDYSFEQIFTGWLFFYPDWTKEKMIKIDDKTSRELLGITTQYASLRDFFDENNQYKLYDTLDNNPLFLKSPLGKTAEKFNIITALYGGYFIKMFPHKTDTSKIDWYATSDQLPAKFDEKQLIFIRKVTQYLQEKALRQEYDDFCNISHKIRKYQQDQMEDATCPTEARFKAEKVYNSMDYFGLIFKIFLSIGIFSFVYFIVCLVKARKINRVVIFILNIFLISGFAYVSVFLGLRAYVSQHFPATNGYEIMLFLSWTALLISAMLQIKFKMALPFGFLLSGLTILVASLSLSSPQITLLMPVLVSPLLSIHVATIMISYLLFAFIAFNGIIAIILHFIKGDNSKQTAYLHIISQLMLYPALFFLTIGIFIGAVWANVSWGRYWGWDPKEVWALITMLIYSFPMHKKSLKLFQKPLFFHVFMTLAFGAVLFTYFGVNLILGGLHSYANG